MGVNHVPFQLAVLVVARSGRCGAYFCPAAVVVVLGSRGLFFFFWYVVATLFADDDMVVVGGVVVGAAVAVADGAGKRHHNGGVEIVEMFVAGIVLFGRHVGGVVVVVVVLASWPVAAVTATAAAAAGGRVEEKRKKKSVKSLRHRCPKTVRCGLEEAQAMVGRMSRRRRKSCPAGLLYPRESKRVAKNCPCRPRDWVAHSPFCASAAVPAGRKETRRRAERGHTKRPEGRATPGLFAPRLATSRGLDGVASNRVDSTCAAAGLLMTDVGGRYGAGDAAAAAAAAVPCKGLYAAKDAQFYPLNSRERCYRTSQRHF